MEHFFHPGENLIKREYISDDDHVFPQEYYTGITRIQTLRRQIDYSIDLLPSLSDGDSQSD